MFAVVPGNLEDMWSLFDSYDMMGVKNWSYFSNFPVCDT